MKKLCVKCKRILTFFEGKITFIQLNRKLSFTVCITVVPVIAHTIKLRSNDILCLPSQIHAKLDDRTLVASQICKILFQLYKTGPQRATIIIQQ